MRKTRFTGVSQRCETHSPTRCPAAPVQLLRQTRPRPGRPAPASDSWRLPHRRHRGIGPVQGRRSRAVRALARPPHDDRRGVAAVLAYGEAHGGHLRPTTARCYHQQLHDYLTGTSARYDCPGYAALTSPPCTPPSPPAATSKPGREPRRPDLRPPTTPPAPATPVWHHLGDPATRHHARRAQHRRPSRGIPHNPAKHAEVPRYKRAKVHPWSPASTACSPTTCKTPTTP